MDGYTTSTWGDSLPDFDSLVWAQGKDEDQATEFLARLAGAGPALELGVGTGRVALPLAARGIAVTGIEASAGMIEQLRAKPGGEQLTVVHGDFADVPVTGEFTLVYCVISTFFLLLTQEEQLRCFANVTRRLAPDGAFVLQTFFPEPYQFEQPQMTETMHVDVAGAVLLMSRHDPVLQRMDRQQAAITAAGIRLYPMAFRYAWPTELDLMGRLAGLHLAERWGGWRNEQYRARDQYISVYRRSRK
ncbi:MAG TPA: class I SAM-dependent methyltransferase [Actinoplanes sp.]|nr:class I SAM-dependent methyltransferase [Actinoplanes sp.]